MKQHTIWKDTSMWTVKNIDEAKASARAELIDNGFENPTDEQISEYIEQDNEFEYQATYNKFKQVQTNGKIVLVADNATWRGRRVGLKYLGHNLGNILQSFFNGYPAFTYDRFNIRGEECHHDQRFCSDSRPNQYLFRELKEEYSDMDDYRLCELLVQDNEINKRNLAKYTKSLRPYLKEVWGI